ncbi:MAG: PD40 domain-containing protein [Bacteroidetes bacterium]|nr:PD40 domain-containing protein [Bacteroidota bacterium]MBS1631030.1 PD40 domain-containing protein [Bacteroidota bacterium]
MSYSFSSDNLKLIFSLSELNEYYKNYIDGHSVSCGAPKVIASFYGGQGTINTPSWSPDSKRIAFASNSK